MGFGFLGPFSNVSEEEVMRRGFLATGRGKERVQEGRTCEVSIVGSMFKSDSAHIFISMGQSTLMG